MPSQGKVARYARGGDYHALIWRKLEELLDWLRGECPGINGRAVADTAPLLERDFARLAGLGWIGKNTMLIDRKLGSFTFLGALLVDAELEYDAPARCRPLRKLHALPRPLPDRRHSPVPTSSTPAAASATGPSSTAGRSPRRNADELDGWVFGCDVCQDVCPWNRKAPPGTQAELGRARRVDQSRPARVAVARRAEWRALLKGTALKRAKRAGLVRNAALVLGSRRLPEAVPALASGSMILKKTPWSAPPRRGRWVGSQPSRHEPPWNVIATMTSHSSRTQSRAPWPRKLTARRK